jgi:[protein-PII] uridylyltransferase
MISKTTLVKVAAEIVHSRAEIPTGPSPGLSWRERREWFRERLESHPPANISAEEIKVHFSQMPPHYWETLLEPELLWGLETIHGFLKMVASPEVPATAPFVTWRQGMAAPHTRMMLCTWDRHALLAKTAASLSAVGLNIVQADIFTRADSIILDQFSITAGPAQAVNETRLQEMRFLLEGALSEPPRFASIWACSRHKFLAPPPSAPPRITIDNESSRSTIVHIEAGDRIGLLYDILQSIADEGLNVNQAHIGTNDGLARDTIHVTDESGHKLLDESSLGALRERLKAALT